MLKINFSLMFAISLAFSVCQFMSGSACTGISFIADDGSKVIARTMEWGGFNLGSNLILIPRGFTHRAITPTGKDGLLIKAKYGYTGIGVLEHHFAAEAINEKGLVGELFYFPKYGKSETFDPSKKEKSVTDAQFLDWVLSNFATVDEMLKELDNIRLIEYGNGFDAPHYNICDATGRHVVLEYFDGKFHIYENTVGIITNSPGFDWQLTNLNNYVNVFAGGNNSRKINEHVTLNAFGVGSAAYGLPGDLTPPSRFVRAAFYVFTALPRKTGKDAIMQSFQILNNFDIPIGAEFNEQEKHKTPEMLSATQWTTATDTKALKFYYRTEWNSMIRCINLKDIDFKKAKYTIKPIDNVKEQPIEFIHF